ncbi:MAG: NAD-dependent succinate-semialdehyde dehydrogenase [Chloroflexi bacterium]|nr:NAD-dependent succinate-semialdehyde dehydrogenase [Chloroflexota bacterium]
MPQQSINPATEEPLAVIQDTTPQEIESALARSAAAFQGWRKTSFRERTALLEQAASYLRTHKATLAATITQEMGKPIVEAEAEVEKCAWNCEFYAGNARRFLANRRVKSAASLSYVAFDPLGTVLAVMPWNFPFWQVFRFAAPAIMAGNTCLLKHASNVPQCSLAIQQVFHETGFPAGVFQSLFVPGAAVEGLIQDSRVQAVTLTGSDVTGSKVAEASGRNLKKTVLELGGADPFIVLPDADLKLAAEMGVRARNQNAGQSCIAAKRFIVVDDVADAFEERFARAVAQLRVGDPMQRDTQVGPLARPDLRDDLESQVQRSVQQGAYPATGGRRLEHKGYFYQPTVLTRVTRQMPAFREETFGPVAAMIRARDAAHAVQLANDSAFGLGASIWTADVKKAQVLARDIEAGGVFINGMVASDPRLPFGGVKRSGYGRELSDFGIREFVNIKTVWIAPAAPVQTPRSE